MKVKPVFLGSVEENREGGLQWEWHFSELEHSLETLVSVNTWF